MRKGEMGMQLRYGAVITAAILSLVGAEPSSAQQAAPDAAGPYGPNGRGGVTATPIKHAIIIIGENRTFDHVFATYKPKSGESVWNLLSEGIVKDDGSPGPNYSKATQSSANNYHNYQLAPPSTPYTHAAARRGRRPVRALRLSIAQHQQNRLQYARQRGGREEVRKRPRAGLLPISCSPAETRMASHVPDPRIWYDGQDARQFAARRLPVDQYDTSPILALRLLCREPRASPVPDVARARLLHQERDREEPVGLPQRSLRLGREHRRRRLQWRSRCALGGFTGEGSTAPQFFNVQAGDAPYLKLLADTYTMSDNYHQAVLGGTGANHIMLGTGDAIFFSDVAHNPATPPNNPVDPTNAGNALARFQIRSVGSRKPEPAAGDEQLLYPGRLRRRIGQPHGDAAERELRRRFLRPLR